MHICCKIKGYFAKILTYLNEKGNTFYTYWLHIDDNNRVMRVKKDDSR